MNLYYFVFIWLWVMYCVSLKVDVTYTYFENGEKLYRWRFIYALILFLPVIYLAAFTTPRSDTGLYLKIYREIPLEWSGIAEKLSSDQSGKGFVVFQWLIKRIFGDNISIFRLLLALLHSIPVLYVFRKYSENFVLTTFLFLITGNHIGWMMNGLRQFLAVSVVMAATPLILKKKYIPLFFIIVLAMTIHSSAMIMLPIVFVVQGKPWNEKTLFFIAASLIMMWAFSKYTGLLDRMLVDTEYAGHIESAAKMGDDGTNPIRVLVNSVPMILSLVGKRQINQENDAVVNLCVNMSIVTVGIYLVSMVTSGIMIGRLPAYTSLYSCILLPKIIRTIFNEKSARMVIVLMMGLYIMYYLYAYG